MGTDVDLVAAAAHVSEVCAAIGNLVSQGNPVPPTTLDVLAEANGDLVEALNAHLYPPLKAVK